LQALLAKCENCGGALRVGDEAALVECSYCGAASSLRAAAGAAPRLRVDPPPPIENGVPGGLIMSAITGGLAGVLLVSALFFSKGSESVGLGVGALVLALLFGLALYLALREVRLYNERKWFRANALPGRATIREVRAKHDGSAVLALDVQVASAGKRNVEHHTTIPALLIPRVTQGVSLPVIVHPHDESMLDVQWHLV
jgi:hypothetical protein